MHSLHYRPLLVALITLTACSTSPVRKTHTPYEAPSAPQPTQEKIVAQAQSYYQRGDLNRAMNTLDSHPIESIPAKERAEYWNLKGLIDLAEKRSAVASQSFHRALEENQNPDYRGYYQYNLATALYSSGKNNEAFDILNAIDLGSIDQNQQHKVLLLKEKISSSLAMLKKKPNAPTTTVNGSPGAVGTDISEMPPPPAVLYEGDVNRKKIGLLIPLTGKYESFGKKVQRAVELALQHSSDSRAKDFEIVAEDSGDSAVTQVNALKKLVEQHQVIGVIGPVLSKGIEELAAKAAYYQVPLLSLAQVQGPPATHLFACSVSAKNQASQLASYAMETQGYTKFVVLAPSNKPGEELALAFKNEILSRSGEVLNIEYYDPSSTDFRTQVDRILQMDPSKRTAEVQELAKKRKELNITRKTTRTAQYFTLPPVINFDAVFIADEAKIAGQIIPTFTYRDAKKLNYLGISSWNSSQLLQRAEDQAEGAVFPVAFNTISANPDIKAFYDLYLATYNTPPGELDALTFDAASVMLKALYSSPSSRSELSEILERTSGVQGATGELSIQDHRCARNLALIQVRKGKFEILPKSVKATE